MQAVIDTFTGLWEFVATFFDFLYYFITNLPDNIADWVETSIKWTMKHLTLLFIYLSALAMEVAFEMMMEFLSSFNYSENITAAWNSIPDGPRSILAYFRVPECVNLLIAAIGTRFTLRFVPFGR